MYMNYAQEVWVTSSYSIKFEVFYSLFYFIFCKYLVPHLDIFEMYLDIWLKKLKNIDEKQWIFIIYYML